jgi:uncharacterized damage-inducible protein DinB
MKNEIRVMLEYAEWANERVLDAVGAMPIDAQERAFAGTFRSFRDAFAHVAGADWIWVERWKGESPAAQPDWATGGDLEVIRRQMRETSATRRAMLDATTEAQLDEVRTFQNLARTRTWTLTLAEMLQHVANHATHHRGQIVSMMREAGATPPQTDYLLFASERRAPAAAAV